MRARVNIVGLDAIGNGGLHAIEEKETAEKHEEDGGRGNEKDEARRLAVAGDGPAETVNYARHRIQSIEPAPSMRHERAGIGDRRGKHPELNDERDDIAHVAIKSVERGKPEADAQSGEEREEKKTGQPESSKSGENAVSKTENGEDNEADGKVHEARKNGGDGKNEAGEIHLGNEALVFDHHVGSHRESAGEIGPGNKSGKVENGIGQAVRGQLGKAAKEKCENQHGKYRLKDNPKDADGGLLIADLDVAPNEEIKELAVLPDFVEVKLEEAAGRLDAHGDGRTGGKREHDIRMCSRGHAY